MQFSTQTKTRGFTLVELMITVAIIAILGAIAFPSYTTSVTKSYRSTAKACLLEYSQFMERFYASNFAYNKDSSGTAMSTPTLPCATQSNMNQRYTFSVDTLAAKTYRVVATPLNTQLTQDTQCGTLSIDQTDTRTASGTSGASGCW
ncbi:type IV pilin protein [Thiothrix lacustris]|uniref:type IV pilin protein n=1 Tax=Thiothrix lacustris TaxID=525917 RepID=UPI0004921D6B|nr:type IV pilin protein [Thiothrix lacustris]